MTVIMEKFLIDFLVIILSLLIRIKYKREREIERFLYQLARSSVGWKWTFNASGAFRIYFDRSGLNTMESSGAWTALCPLTWVAKQTTGLGYCNTTQFLSAARAMGYSHGLARTIQRATSRNPLHSRKLRRKLQSVLQISKTISN